MDVSKIKLVAFDLDGTLTQHKTPLSDEHRAVLDKLGEKYKLVMLGAGMCRRIFNQMGQYPIDIYGNYGMQMALYRPELKDIEIVENVTMPCDKESVDKRVTMLREKYGYTEYAGENVEYHASGAVTFPVLGTKAKQEDKLAFDPDRSKRRAIYEDVKQVFSDYIVFVGGSCLLRSLGRCAACGRRMCAAEHSSEWSLSVLHAPLQSFGAAVEHSRLTGRLLRSRCGTLWRARRL